MFALIRRLRATASRCCWSSRTRSSRWRSRTAPTCSRTAAVAMQGRGTRTAEAIPTCARTTWGFEHGRRSTHLPSCTAAGCWSPAPAAGIGLATAARAAGDGARVGRGGAGRAAGGVHARAACRRTGAGAGPARRRRLRRAAAASCAGARRPAGRRSPAAPASSSRRAPTTPRSTSGAPTLEVNLSCDLRAGTRGDRAAAPGRRGRWQRGGDQQPDRPGRACARRRLCGVARPV